MAESTPLVELVAVLFPVLALVGLPVFCWAFVHRRWSQGKMFWQQPDDHHDTGRLRKAQRRWMKND